MRLDNRGNWTLIGLLAAAAIVVILAVVYLGGSGEMTTVGGDSELLDKSSEKQTVVGKSLDTAKSTACREQLNQIRLGIVNYKATSTADSNPPSLKDIGLGVSASYFQCPVSDQPYKYDPGAGTVQCPTHTDY